ncbi:MAG: ABC transporter permease [Spirochaetaceae bacterium 4572_59]|nr:MAG: ABC transporter permease [Spirochaetaceae bacterium 4572_59]
MKKSKGRIFFEIYNYSILVSMAALCLFPMIHVLAVSFSSGSAAAAGWVSLWPVDFTLSSYTFVLEKADFISSLMVSFQRLFWGLIASLTITIITAYPLSKGKRDLRIRGIYIWVFIFTMLFNGGLIPTYMIIKETGLLDSIGALVIPCAVNVYFIILLMNFFKNIPKSLEEAAFIDGAGHWTTLFKIYLPLSLPALATITLFISVFHWNSWFDGLIYMNRPENYPLSSFLQTVVIQRDLTFITDTREIEMLSKVDGKTVKSAQIFLGALPILAVYPFLQRYFVKGITLGSVKG